MPEVLRRIARIEYFPVVLALMLAPVAGWGVALILAAGGCAVLAFLSVLAAPVAELRPIPVRVSTRARRQPFRR